MERIERIGSFEAPEKEVKKEIGLLGHF